MVRKVPMPRKGLNIQLVGSIWNTKPVGIIWNIQSVGLVTSRPTHKGKGRLVNIERFLGPNTFSSVKTGSPIRFQHCQS